MKLRMVVKREDGTEKGIGGERNSEELNKASIEIESWEKGKRLRWKR